MKYRELIQFNPIDEIIKFEKLDNEEKAKEFYTNKSISTSHDQ